jgi:hypothetical protein
MLSRSTVGIPRQLAEGRLVMSVSLVPRTDDVEIYVVLNQLQTGRVWREIDEELANEAAVIEWIVEGQFDQPVRIVAFNSVEGWSRDVTEDISLKLLDLSRQGRVLGREFVERITSSRLSDRKPIAGVLPLGPTDKGHCSQ